MPEETARRALLISKTWVQASIVVILLGFFVLGLLAYRTYSADPPIPDRVVDPAGQTVFTGDEISNGQRVFLNNGLMEYGSIFGHGAYLGPDYTADYLHRAALSVQDQYAGAGSDRAGRQTISDFQTNRYDSEADTLEYTSAQARAFSELDAHYLDYFSDPTTEQGLRPDAIDNPQQAHELTAFFSWSAWAASARRPGHNYSYTNNWPPEKLVDNGPTANVVLWSVVSLIALLGGIGLLFAAFGRWNFLGWQGREQAALSFRRPGDVVLTPAQRACAWFFLVMAALFLIQTMVGAASQHYRAELGDFFGIDLAQLLPFNLARTFHVQLAIFFVSTSFLAAGIFLAPMIAGREPRRQHWLAYGLLAALAIVVFGSLIGEFGGVHGWFGEDGSIFGIQGFEYLDLGRFWQVLLVIGLFFWAALIFRGLRGRLQREHKGNLPWLFFFAALAIPAFYAVGLIARSGDSFTVTDFWRFWVVHLWVEDFLELFTTVMVAYVFVLPALLALATWLQLVGSTPKEGSIALIAAHAAGMPGLLVAPGAWKEKLGRIDFALLGGITAMLAGAPHWWVFLDTLSRSWTLYDTPSLQFATWPHTVGYVLGGAAPGFILTGASTLPVMAALCAFVYPGRFGMGIGLGAVLSCAGIGAVAYGVVPSELLMKLPLLPNIHHIANSFLAASLAPMLLVAGVGIAAAWKRPLTGRRCGWRTALRRPPCCARPSCQAARFR